MFSLQWCFLGAYLPVIRGARMWAQEPFFFLAVLIFRRPLPPLYSSVSGDSGLCLRFQIMIRFIISRERELRFFSESFKVIGI